MRIATYNVNGINGRLPVLLRWLKEERPDIACLQELRAPQEKFPLQEIKRLGYHAIWHGQKSWNGVAILSRGAVPIETRRGLPGDPEDLNSRYIEAQVGDLIVASIYLPNGNPAPGPKFDYKLAWFRRFNAYAARLLKTRRPVILCGDYNAVPTELDAYKPERWVGDAVFFPETRELYRRLIAQGWTDALRKMHPGQVVFTYWDYFRNAFGRNAGLRMDHILLSPDLASRLVAAGVDRNVRSWERTSDHAPTWVILEEVARKSRMRTTAKPPLGRKK
jgi:exodeoxyribonuclease-3